MFDEPLLIVVTGPTGSGKTKLSLSLAKTLDCSIISADSRQIFKEIPIGSAAPDDRELSEVPHYFIGTHSIHDEMNAGIYERLALDKLEVLFQEKPVQVVCGGTGLYIKALLYGLDTIPKASEETRSKLRLAWEEDPENLVLELKTLDPDYSKLVDLNNKHRVIRALEVIRETGLPFSSFRTNKGTNRPFKHVILSIEIPREQLYNQINQRTSLMMERGWLKEAESVYKFRDLNSLQTVGFKELFEYFDRDLSLEEAIEKIKMNTRRYAKRQVTWIRNQESPIYINPDESVASILEKVKKKLS